MDWVAMTYYCIDPGDYYFDFGDAVGARPSEGAGSTVRSFAMSAEVAREA